MCSHSSGNLTRTNPTVINDTEIVILLRSFDVQFGGFKDRRWPYIGSTDRNGINDLDDRFAVQNMHPRKLSLVFRHELVKLSRIYCFSMRIRLGLSTCVGVDFGQICMLK